MSSLSLEKVSFINRFQGVHEEDTGLKCLQNERISEAMNHKTIIQLA